MATFTSKATGNWNSAGQTTWNEVGTPGNGDTVTIALAHIVTVDDGATVIIGTSGVAGTAAITITGRLIIGTGSTLIIRGDMILNAATNAGAGTSGFYQMTMNAGSILEFDSSLAASPSTTNYVCGPGQSLAPDSRIRILGSSGSRCAVRSNAGGANGYFGLRAKSSRVGCMEATYCDFLRIGTSAIPAFNPNPTGTNGFVDTFSLTDCTLDFCGTELQATALAATVVFSYTRVIRTNTLSTNCGLVAGAVALTTGTRSYTDCVFDVYFGNDSYVMAGFTFTRCVFWASHGIIGNTVKHTFNSCFFRKFVSGSLAQGAVAKVVTLGGDYNSCYYFNDETSTGNQKWWAPSLNFDVTFNRGHLETTHPTDSTGDFISIINNPATVLTCTARYMTTSRTSASPLERPETIVSMAPGGAASGCSNVRVVLEHNTWIASTESQLSTGETNSNAASTVGKFRSNITYATRSPAGTYQYHIHDYNATGAGNQLTAASSDITNNCGFGLKTGSDGFGYNGNFAGTPGASDVNVDPQFVDISRTSLKWAGSMGMPETSSSVLSLLSADTSRIDTLLNWVQGGWAPTNALLRNAGHDGVTIGAVEYVALGGNTFGYVLGDRTVSNYTF